MDGDSTEASDVAVSSEVPVSPEQASTPLADVTVPFASEPTSTRRQLLGTAGSAALDTALLGGAVAATVAAAGAAPALREKPTGFSLNPFNWFHKSEATSPTETETPIVVPTSAGTLMTDASSTTLTDPAQTGSTTETDTPAPASSQTPEQPVVPGEAPNTVLGKIANMVGLAGKKP